MKNIVELLGHYGNDTIIALSAWTSTSRELTEEKRRRIDKLLKMLAEEGHHTPFEKSLLHFKITCETASHIHLLKHRIATSVNGESARYKEYQEDKYYIPEDWPEFMQRELEEYTSMGFQNYHRAIKILQEYGLTKKRAKESARFFLPHSLQLDFDVSFNFRSFMHFQNLRAKNNAQDEIHNIADQMLALVRATGDFDHSLKGFGY